MFSWSDSVKWTPHCWRNHIVKIILHNSVEEFHHLKHIEVGVCGQRKLPPTNPQSIIVWRSTLYRTRRIVSVMDHIKPYFNRTMSVRRNITFIIYLCVLHERNVLSEFMMKAMTSRCTDTVTQSHRINITTFTLKRVLWKGDSCIAPNADFSLVKLLWQLHTLRMLNIIDFHRDLVPTAFSFWL